MAIMVAIPFGSRVDVYNEKNKCIWHRDGTLHGYTGSTVSIRYGNKISTYDEKGSEIASHSV